MGSADNVRCVSKHRRRLAWVLGVLGIAFVLIGLAGTVLAAQAPSVSAVPVNASIESTINIGCDTMPPVRISFLWIEMRRVQDYYDAPCDRTYRAGDKIQVYVASNDPTNIGPTAGWIMHPDEHDPFAPFGPNAIGPMLVLLGALTVLAGVVFIVTGARLSKAIQTP